MPTENTASANIFVLGGKMDSRSMVCRLLARGLLEIRVASMQGDPEVAFHLADLLHNVPQQMERVSQGAGDHSEILDWLRMRAEQKGLIRWLDHAVSEIDDAASVLPDLPAPATEGI